MLADLKSAEIEREWIQPMITRLIAYSTVALTASAAHAAPLTVSSGVGDLPAIAAYDLITFDGPLPAGVSLTFSGDVGLGAIRRRV